jgi:uncharacterized protein (DUF433 family)
MSVTLTPNEAAFTVGRDVNAVQRAVDSGVVEKRTQTVRGRTRRVFGRSELRFFRVITGVEEDLTLRGRRKLYEALLHPRGKRVTVGPFEIDIADVDRQIDERLAELERIRGAVESGSAGEPVLRGTAVPVHVVAALAEAGGVEEAARAYPSLSKAAVDAAVAYAQVYPKKGRPYPQKSLKRMMSELALPDEVFGQPDSEAGPREVYL